MRLSLSLVLALVATNASVQAYDSSNKGDADARAEAKAPMTPLSLIKDLTKAADLTHLLRTKPVKNLFSVFGVNITERLDIAEEALNIWDPRVQFVTDDNYKELIEDEPWRTEDNENRIWFIIVSAYTIRQDALSQYADESFDAAHNDTLIANDLPHVKWGRVDYGAVTRITTRWGVWNAPWLVVIRNRGKELRFYNIRSYKLPKEAIRSFLLQEQWRQTDPWSTAWSPGGSREWLLEYFGEILGFIFRHAIILPSWLLYVFSGIVGSLLVNMMHGSGSSKTPVRQAPPPTSGAAVSPQQGQEVASTTSVSSPSGKTKKRAGKGKK